MDIVVWNMSSRVFSLIQSRTLLNTFFSKHGQKCELHNKHEATYIIQPIDIIKFDAKKTKTNKKQNKTKNSA